MSPEEAEQMLSEWVIVTRDRDTRVRAAVAVALSKHRVHRLTGIGRSTIDRILAAAAPAWTGRGHTGPQRTSSGSAREMLPAEPLLNGRRLGDLNPGWARTQTALAVRRHRPD